MSGLVNDNNLKLAGMATTQAMLLNAKYYQNLAPHNDYANIKHDSKPQHDFK